MDATNKTITLVTGANQGIGFAIATKLASEHNHYVIMAGRRLDAIESAAARLQEQNLAVEPIVIDLDVEETIDAAVEHVQRKFGHIDVLVNNAGIARVAPEVAESTRCMYAAILGTNVVGTVAVTEKFLPLLAQSPLVKRIVFVSSGAGSMTNWATPGSLTRSFKAPAYAVSKSAVNAVCLQYAVAYEQDKSWKINCCCPGYCATNLNKYSGKDSPETGAEIICRLATLEEDGPTGTFGNAQGPMPW